MKWLALALLLLCAACAKPKVDAKPQPAQTGISSFDNHTMAAAESNTATDCGCFTPTKDGGLIW